MLAAMNRKPTFISVSPAMSQHAGIASRKTLHPISGVRSSAARTSGLSAGPASLRADDGRPSSSVASTSVLSSLPTCSWPPCSWPPCSKGASFAKKRQESEKPTMTSQQPDSPMNICALLTVSAKDVGQK